MKLETQDNIIEVNFFVTNLAFPVVVFICSEWDKIQVDYLNHNFKKTGYTTISLCQWCINHNIKYQILYPLSLLIVLKNPYKYFLFLKIKYFIIPKLEKA